MKVVNLVDVWKNTWCSLICGFCVGHEFYWEDGALFCFTCTFSKHFFCKLGRDI